MATALVNTNNGTPTRSGATVTFTYTPTNANSLVCLWMLFPTSGAHTISSVATATPGSITWLGGANAQATWSAESLLMRSWLGYNHNTSGGVTTVTFNSTLPSGTYLWIVDEYFNAAATSWTLARQGFMLSGTATPALSSASQSVNKNDMFAGHLFTINSGDVLTASNPQGWINYDLTDGIMNGDAPATAALPQTGFAIAPTDGWAMATTVATPVLPTDPWVPPTVGMGIN
jgi:hypothetical protein